MRLEVDDIHVERGGRRVLAGLSFILHPGEALIVTGPNGAGKSTLLRALAGLLPLAAGRIRIEAGKDAPPSREIAHYVGHGDANRASLTPTENLAFWASMLTRRAPTSQTMHPVDALAAFGLAGVADLPLAVLSAGQKRRVALARLLSASRPLWLLDEPTTALDAASQTGLMEHMRTHLGHGGMIVAATHAMPDVLGARYLALG